VSDDLRQLQLRLEARIAGLGRAIVAFSGGVDSSLVAALAARALGDRALAVTAVSPAVAEGELEGARSVARAVGIRHRTVDTDELARAGYRRNGPDRCFHCKAELYSVLTSLANEAGGATVLSGANADDAGDWRPGLRAAADHGVVHPLLEAQVDKAQVRTLAERLHVPSAQKPATPCLASRIPFGTPVTPSALARVDRAERAVRALGYRELRVRHYGDMARVELAAADLERAGDSARSAALKAAVRAAGGYGEVTIDPRPFRSGSLTRVYLRAADSTRRVALGTVPDMVEHS
jgi:pyridinium-3,5-biscarboxylic acid mononucleotide sulfurtransferase